MRKKRLEQTYNEIYHDFVDEVILVDDNSQDNTKIVSKKLNTKQLFTKKTKATAATRNHVIKQH